MAENSEECPVCGSFDIIYRDEKNKYSKVCNRCWTTIDSDYKDHYQITFKCKKCGSSECVLEDTDDIFATICKKCGDRKVIIEKRTTVDKRFDKPVVHTSPFIIEDKRPRCPKCGSTYIQVVKRKHSFWGGFRTEEVDRVCVYCKHRW